MKQSTKTPFFEKENGVFVLMYLIKGSRIFELNQSYNLEKRSCFRINVPSYSLFYCNEFVLQN
ncbi:MAG: hypothetical protein A2Y79_07225 [Deltaproteobacteria bacterium RBG_13_43_22]|nr:MAG: hypothetical protein A2Y79_07225 [Deltaproteobacteria bacterium RBG_13_43_22]